MDGEEAKVMLRVDRTDGSGCGSCCCACGCSGCDGSPTPEDCCKFFDNVNSGSGSSPGSFALAPGRPRGVLTGVPIGVPEGGGVGRGG